MKLHLDDHTGIHAIDAYDAGGVTIDGRRYAGSLIVSARSVTAAWPVDHAAQLTEGHLAAIEAHEVEIVLLGAGHVRRGVDPRLMVWFAERGMGLEVMDSGAACRTYNVLAGEGRSVAAAIIVEAAATGPA